jgi:hypothetical protein
VGKQKVQAAIKMFNTMYDVLKMIPGTYCPRCANDRGLLTEHGICQECVDNIQTVFTWSTYQQWEQRIGQEKALFVCLGPWRRVLHEARRGEDVCHNY